MTAMKSSVTMMPSSLFLFGLLGTIVCSMIRISLISLICPIRPIRPICPIRPIRPIGPISPIRPIILIPLLIPEEILSLGFLLAWCLGTEDGLQRVGVVARIPGLGTDGHWRRREVLYLFQVET